MYSVAEQIGSSKPPPTSHEQVVPPQRNSRTTSQVVTSAAAVACLACGWCCSNANPKLVHTVLARQGSASAKDMLLGDAVHVAWRGSWKEERSSSKAQAWSGPVWLAKRPVLWCGMPADAEVQSQQEPQ